MEHIDSIENTHYMENIRNIKRFVDNDDTIIRIYPLGFTIL